MKRKLFLSIFIVSLLLPSTGLLAKVDCVRFEYATVPVKYARRPALALHLHWARRTILHQYKLGADLMLSFLPTYLISIIPGAVFYTQAKKALTSYCTNNDCECGNIRRATFYDYWYQPSYETQYQKDVIKEKTPSVKTVGQIYFHYPTLRHFTFGQLLEPLSFLLSEIFTGHFSLTIGSSKKQRHLADISLLLQRWDEPLSMLRLGYVYHWSSDYNLKKPSKNIHIGIGLSQIGISYRYSPGMRAFGYYLRFSYFTVTNSKNIKRIIYGVNLETQFYPSSQIFNNSSISFIFGVPFAH